MTVYPENQGYLALINVTGARTALLVQSPALSDLQERLSSWQKAGNTPEILVLGTLNAELMNQISRSGILADLKEFHFPEMDKRPAYLLKAIDELKTRKVKSGPLRQNRYVPLRHAELLVLAPHEYSVYDEKTRITFKLIRGRKSFVLAPFLEKELIQVLRKSYGRGLRTDIVIAAGINDISREEVLKNFEKPEIILTSEFRGKEPVHFQTQGSKIKRML